MYKHRARQVSLLVFALMGIIALIALSLTRGATSAQAVTRPSLPEAKTTQKQPDCNNAYSSPVFNKTVVIDNNELICHDLTSFGGSVAINGILRGNLVAFGDRVVIAGTVDGDIRLYSSTITFISGSVVHGDIHLYGSRWNAENDVRLNGTVIDHTQQIVEDGSRFHFPFWAILIWGTLGIVLTTLLPEHVMLVRTTALSKTQRSLWLGLLSVLLMPLVFLVLIALILTIPLAIIVAIVLIAAWALGVVSVGLQVGEFLVKKVSTRPHARLTHVLVGVIVLALAGSLPYIGWVITVGAGLLGLGAVFLSRFGTRLYSQPRQPLTL